ncbi:hypothetical protein KVE54_05955 [Helicobacter pylori]|nr:hypothetical protein KVE54_05955 [Helicobacter pylori]
MDNTLKHLAIIMDGRGFSTSSTCEIGLSEKTRFSWQHIAYLVDACTL